MQSTVGIAFLDASLAGYDKYASTHKCASVLPAASTAAPLQRHIQHESMNATAVCFAVDGDTVANKAGCRRASWYLRTVTSFGFGLSRTLAPPNVIRLATHSPKTFPSIIKSGECVARSTPQG
eukprot:scaffold5964_cov125-Skeletonema_menzelii.AAC.1